MMNSVFRLSLVAVLTATLTWGSFSCTQEMSPVPSKEVAISEDIILAPFNKDGLFLLLGELGMSLPQGKWPSSSLLTTHGVYCSDLFYLDTNESAHVVVSSDNHLYGYPFLDQTASNDHTSGIWVDMMHISMRDQLPSGEAGLSSWRSGYSNSNYRQIGTIFEGSFDFSIPEPGFSTVTLINEDELKPHSCHIEIRIFQKP